MANPSMFHVKHILARHSAKQRAEDIRLHDNAVMFLRNMAAFPCILLKKDVQIG